MCDQTQSPPVCVAMPGGPDAPVADGSIDAAPACTDSSTCAAADPICDQTTHTCRGCIADTECTGGVCIEYNGKCVPDANVLFVGMMGSDGGSCTRMAPCATFGYAFTLVNATMYVVRVGDGNYVEPIHLPSNGGATQVVLSGEDRDPAGATFSPLTSPGMLFDGGTNVLLEGFAVMNSPGDGIQARGTLVASRLDVSNNSSNGINQSSMDASGGMRVVDSKLTNNQQLGVLSGKGYVDVERDYVIGNQGGGIRTQQGPITIINCIVAKNGSLTSNVGGLRLDNLTVAGSDIELDTVAYNSIQAGTNAPGVQAGNTVAITNMILADNGAAGSAQMSSNVAVTHSLFEGGPQPQGMGNKTGSPAFKDITNGDFHITAGSMAIDNATTTTIGVDIDGETRPYGAGPDMGADEYHP